MLRIHHTVYVPRPPERVWAVFEDLPAWPKWNPVTPHARWQTEGQWRRGARFELSLRLKNKRTILRPEVVAVAPPRSVTWVGRGFGVTRRRSFAFEPEEHGTRVTTTETFSGPLLFIWRLAVPPARLRAISAKWLEALKAESER